MPVLPQTAAMKWHRTGKPVRAGDKKQWIILEWPKEGCTVHGEATEMW